MLVAGIIALALLVSATLSWFAFRAGKAEAQVVAMRAQVADMPRLRTEVHSLTAQVVALSQQGVELQRHVDAANATMTSLSMDVTAQRMAIQALVVKLTEKRPERRRFDPPPSSSGVMNRSDDGIVHHLESNAEQTACGEKASRIVVGFSGRTGEVGWTRHRERTTCQACLASLLLTDNDETTVMSRRSA